MCHSIPDRRIGNLHFFPRHVLWPGANSDPIWMPGSTNNSRFGKRPHWATQPPTVWNWQNYYFGELRTCSGLDTYIDKRPTFGFGPGHNRRAVKFPHFVNFWLRPGLETQRPRAGLDILGVQARHSLPNPRAPRTSSLIWTFGHLSPNPDTPGPIQGRFARRVWVPPRRVQSCQVRVPWPVWVPWQVREFRPVLTIRTGHFFFPVGPGSSPGGSGFRPR